VDLILVIILTLALVPLVLLTSGALRVVVGLLFILFSPGYALMAALFPRKEQLDTVERIALSFGLSIAIVPLICLILNYTPWGIRPEPILTCIAPFIIVASSVALFRRWSIPKEHRFVPSLRIKLPSWRGQSTMDKALMAVLIISILAGIGALTYVVGIPRVGESFTEFYVVGPEGMAEDYPRELALGEEGTITVGVVNHEHQVTAYSIEVKIDGVTVQEIDPISLAYEEKWEQPITFVASKAGEDQKLEFLLYRDAESEPYLKLHLWLDVTVTE